MSLTFKIYEKISDNYNELGTVLHESTLSKIAHNISAQEMSKLYVEAVTEASESSGEFYVAPLSTWI